MHNFIRDALTKLQIAVNEYNIRRFERKLAFMKTRSYNQK